MPNKPKMVWSVCNTCKRVYSVALKELKRGRKFCSRSCSNIGRKYPKRNQYGSQNPNWKGGKTKHSKGYICQYAPFHPRSHNGYVLEHILVMEKKIGRMLGCDEVVHHKDEEKSNNNPRNLELFSSTGKHTSFHAKARRGEITIAK